MFVCVTWEWLETYKSCYESNSLLETRALAEPLRKWTWIQVVLSKMHAYSVFAHEQYLFSFWQSVKIYLEQGSITR